MTQTDAPPVLDFDALLAPIPGENSAGVDLREDSKESRKYYEVRDLRKAEIDNERINQRFALMTAEDLDYELGLLQADPRRPSDWGAVIKKATSLIATSSKDLWVVAWLTEALVREHGMAGLRDGIRLGRELCEQYWDSIWPRPNDDEGGYDWTLSQLNGLDETLEKSIDRVSLFRKDLLAPKERIMTLLSYEEGEKLGRLSSELRTAKIAAGATTIEDFQLASKKAPIEELILQAATNVSAASELSKYYDTLQGLTPGSARISNIESAISRFANRFDQLTKNRIAMEQQEPGDPIAMSVEDSSTNETASTATRSVSMINKQIMTRDDALEGLLKVADFFRRTEPHSPVSYALEQAVRWGRMPLPELLGDLISDSSVREEMFRRLGIQNNDERQNSDDDN